MSVSVRAYLVNVHELQSIYGSEDRILLGELEAAFRDELEIDEMPERVMALDSVGTRGEREKMEPDHPTLREAMHAIVAGTIPDEGEGIPYVGALELICQHVGTPLPNRPFEGFRGVNILHQVDRLGDLVDGWNPPIPIPLSRGICGISYLTCAEATAALARLPLVELAMPFDPDPSWEGGAELRAWSEEWLQRMRVQYRSWLEEAMHMGKDIVAFLS